MWGRHQSFRDPMVILMKKEERTCKGCKNEITAWGRKACDLGNRHGRRCRSYEEQPRTSRPCSQQ